MKEKTLIRFFIILGLLFSLAYAGFLYFLFLMAYFASSNNSVTLFINLFGEANFELVLVSVTMCIALSSTMYILFEMRKRKRIESKEVI